jgi:hypothetical protein
VRTAQRPKGLPRAKESAGDIEEADITLTRDFVSASDEISCLTCLGYLIGCHFATLGRQGTSLGRG